jgi:hypothetical protein
MLRECIAIERLSYMFVAQILICSMLSADCVILEDSRGLSLTKAQCVIRQKEMLVDITFEMPEYSLVDRTCRKAKYQPV